MGHYIISQIITTVYYVWKQCANIIYTMHLFVYEWASEMLFKIKVHLTSSGMTDGYINLTILWILILNKVLYSFLISSSTITQIMIVQLAIKRLIETRSPSLLCLLFIYLFSLRNYVLSVKIGIIWLQSSTSQRAAFCLDNTTGIARETGAIALTMHELYHFLYKYPST